MTLPQMSTEELKEQKETMLRWIERRGKEHPTTEENLAVLVDFKKHLSAIEAELHGRS